MTNTPSKEHPHGDERSREIRERAQALVGEIMACENAIDNECFNHGSYFHAEAALQSERERGFTEGEDSGYRRGIRECWGIMDRHKREVQKMCPDYVHELVCAMQEVKELLPSSQTTTKGDKE